MSTFLFHDFSWEKFLILSIICFFGAIVDAISGGGGLITLPAYFSIGLNPYVALGTNKLSAALSTIASAFKFWQAKKINKEIISRIFLYSFAGAVLGVKTAVSIDVKYFKLISFFILIIVFLYALKNKNMGEISHYKGVNPKNILFGKIMAFSLGFYDGFLGPGTAAFLMFCLIKIFKLDFANASGNTKVLNLSSNAASLIVFTYLGKINWAYGIGIAIVMTFGAILGSKLAILKGNKFIKPVFLIVTAILILKMSRDIFF
ncbi:sulfite exporter TauE/SafE family protein [Fusobacterium russii]|uniref:sulfite exporter TauE/SafE family protein n=1 Tax=Fusobacterium russii TaxID=854 RepID=UPI0003A4830B|nr:TSUP family transporter [Fusobacterium russii]